MSERWQERLIKEQAELEAKLFKLVEFIDGEKFFEIPSHRERELLYAQRMYMEGYNSTLKELLMLMGLRKQESDASSSA
jgi:3'-phosphoadenosine 5'-phosphosulfate sulfotransferase (PAPS reductase)/FAD synthetase